MASGRDDFIIAVRSAFLKKNNKQQFSLLALIIFSIFIRSGCHCQEFTMKHYIVVTRTHLKKVDQGSGQGANRFERRCSEHTR